MVWANPLRRLSASSCSAVLLSASSLEDSAASEPGFARRPGGLSSSCLVDSLGGRAVKEARLGMVGEDMEDKETA